MKLKIYSLYDSKISAFATPFFLRTQGEAIRGLIELVNDPKTRVCKHAEDFTLFELGWFEDENGCVERHPTPLNIALAIEHKDIRPKQPTETEGA